MAIDAKSGNVLWQYQRPRPAGSSVAHDTSRGVALYGDKVYFAAGEAVMVALDAKTGRVVWDNGRRGQCVGILHLARTVGRRGQGDGGHVRR